MRDWFRAFSLSELKRDILLARAERLKYPSSSPGLLKGALFFSHSAILRSPSIHNRDSEVSEARVNFPTNRERPLNPLIRLVISESVYCLRRRRKFSRICRRDERKGGEREREGRVSRREDVDRSEQKGRLQFAHSLEPLLLDLLPSGVSFLPTGSAKHHPTPYGDGTEFYDLELWW